MKEYCHFSKTPQKTIAVIGRLANQDNTGDHGSSDSRPLYVINPYEGIKAYHDKIGNNVIYNDGTNIEAANQLANEADEVILVVGFDHTTEGEYASMSREQMYEAAQNGGEGSSSFIGGGDRKDLRLLPQDEALVQALAGSNPRLVVVYVGGSAIDLSGWDSKIPAILFSWYSGMEGGNALANILYGNVNPSGKLPFSIAKNQEDYPYFEPFALEIDYGYYHGYTLFNKKNIEPAYPFGYGLSYSEYQYSDLSIQNAELGLDSLLTVSVNITNQSDRTGKEVAQLYVGFKNSAVDRPIKVLRDFTKVTIKPGETKQVKMSVKIEDLAWYNPDSKSWEVELMDYEIYVGGSSSLDDLLVSSFTVRSFN